LLAGQGAGPAVGWLVAGVAPACFSVILLFNQGIPRNVEVELEAFDA
jgi:hypothetical protein